MLLHKIEPGGKFEEEKLEVLNCRHIRGYVSDVFSEPDFLKSF
jgi:hypothetical protein